MLKLPLSSTNLITSNYVSYSQYYSREVSLSRKKSTLAQLRECRLATRILLNEMGWFKTSKGFDVRIKLYLISFKPSACLFHHLVKTYFIKLH